MEGMPGMTTPPTMDNVHDMHDMAMTHMTFFWGKNSEILFEDWPGTNSGGMYALALILVFVLAFLVEFLSHSKLTKDGSNHVVAGVVKTLVHGIRVGLAYLVMLAVMSFNGGVFIVVIIGHAVGFLVFRSGVFKKSTQDPEENKPDLPPMSC